MKMQKKYRSKIEFIRFLPVIICLLLYVSLLIWCNLGRLNFLAICLLSCIPPYILSIQTHYIIDNEILIIKYGFFLNVKIDIKTIKAIQEIKNRMEVRYKKYDRITLSLKDKCGFINDLVSVNSDIEVN